MGFYALDTPIFTLCIYIISNYICGFLNLSLVDEISAGICTAAVEKGARFRAPLIRMLVIFPLDDMILG